MINQQHAPFFTVSFLHDYFTSKKCGDVEVVPATDCLALFKGLNLQWRNTASEFRTWILINELGGPFINNPLATPPDDKVYRKYYEQSIFRLYLKSRNNLFSNYTNISPVNGKKYYFSNVANNKRGSVLFASKAIADHANATNYVPGTMVMKPGTDNVFEAITKHTSVAVADLNDTSKWEPLSAAAYPTANDQVECSTSGQYTLALPAPVPRAEIAIYAFDFNPVTPGFTIAVGEKEIQYFNVGEEQSAIPVKLSHLKPGRYKITVNATSREVYYDPALQDESILGIMEIFNHLPAANTYAFLNAAEIIQPKQYTIQFPARRVLWKYTRKDARALSLTDTGGTAYAFSLLSNDFVSQKPIPLAEAAVTTLVLTFNPPDFKLTAVPNPPFNRLGKYTQAGYDYLCSEMFLNY
ncbi:hypothetical protein [Paraflavitalea soli]|nr:hypothetical protein [Paraflavitalea soli]